MLYPCGNGKARTVFVLHAKEEMPVPIREEDRKRLLEKANSLPLTPAFTS